MSALPALSAAMDVLTPEDYSSDFLDPARTEPEKQALWERYYLDRRVSWTGWLEDCRSHGSFLHARVRIDVGAARLRLFVALVPSELQTLLAVRAETPVQVTGTLARRSAGMRNDWICVDDGRLFAPV
ncbi:MAG TPA: hypothetical protein VMW27_28310 [Thermoanaerobaculia bacterium]|nr:hypothetical protein [Thermoanaerobaculia bacterium]